MISICVFDLSELCIVRKQIGFTLIEVLIALMIIAIALAAAVRATTESIRTTRHVRNVTIAHFIAMNVISEIQTNMLPLSESNNPARGKTNMLGQDWTWSATIQSKDQFNLETIAVKVRLKDRVLTMVTGYHAQ
jgi:general secretion pathway protein I